MIKRKEFYQSHLQELESKVKIFKSKASLIGWMRILFFLIFGVSIWLSIQLYIYYLILGAVSFATFLGLLKYHLKLEFDRDFVQHQIEILKNELMVLNGEPGFWNNGQQFHQASSYSNDLDIFGPYSLYHFINRTNTNNGANNLAQQLIQPELQSQNILERQKAIEEMKDHFSFRIQWQAYGRLLENGADMKSIFKDKLTFTLEFIHYKWLKPLLIILPLIALSTTVYYMISGIFQPMMYSILLNLGVVASFLKKTLFRQKAVDGLKKIMESYVRQIELYELQKWESELNKINQKSLNESHQALRELTNIGEWFDRRMNVVVGTIFNAYVLYDFYCVLRLERWIEKYQSKYHIWFDTLGEIEARQSLATFSFNHPTFHLPQLSTDNSIKAVEIGHPLIEESKNIKNSFEIAHPEKLVLITGSNMSGKSTFLRTIGVSLVMAQVGLPVNAQEFIFKPMFICTSLKQTDNLHENVSLFHAELLRLQSIREQLDQNVLTLVLIDEMLRGTNSEDKLFGSKQLMEELTEENIFGLIASHDLELGKLEQKYSGIIRNACFESVIENNELSFDYKLKKGVATNKNASFLMKRMRVIRKIDEKN